MLKKTVAFACAALLLLSAAGALAGGEARKVKPAYYNPENDVAALGNGLRNTSAVIIQAMRGGTFSANLLPVDADTLLWYGSFAYHDIPQVDAFDNAYDVVMPRQDAYAVAVNRRGERKWSLRLGDPQSGNGFARAWLLPDERILLLFYTPYGGWDSQYYIVSKEGEVREMLPGYKAGELGLLETLQPVHGGYFGGGYEVADHALGVMYAETNFTFFDENLNVVWQNKSEAYIPGSYGCVRETGDGFLIGGARYPGLDRDDPGMNPVVGAAAVVTKIGLDGETIWTYEGHEFSMTGASDILPTADGGALFLTGFDPTRATPYDAKETTTFVKLDADGALEWVKQNDGRILSSISGFVPYQDGYLLSGQLVGDAQSCAVLYVSADGTLLQRVDVELEGTGDAYVYSALAAAPDGNVYVYGSWTTTQSELAGMDSKPECTLFYLSMDEVISP